MTTKQNRNRERFIRWQSYRVNQLSFSINLFLGFAIASLAYAINIKLNGTSVDAKALTSAIVFWSASAATGAVATITRLLDFRYTALKIRNGGISSTVIAKWAGKVTWGAFWTQITTYSIGAYYFIVDVALS